MYQQVIGEQVLMDPWNRAGRYFAVMRYEHRLVAATIVLLVLAGCKKEEDPRAPVVTIVAPGNGFDLSVPDTLNVVVDVSAEGSLDQVSFILSNTNGFPIVEPLYVVPATNPVRLEVGIPITSELVPSGDYKLTVQAGSGGAHGKDHAELDIIGAPLRLRRVFAIGRPDEGSASIHLIDSTGEITLTNTLLMDLGGAAVSSAAGTFTVMGAVTGPLIAFAPNGVQVPWQKPNLGNSGVPWFTSLDLCVDGRYYVGTTDGRLRGYHAGNGAVERVCDLSGGYRAKCTALVGQRLVVAQVDQTGSAQRLGVYQASSGAPVDERPLEQTVVAIFRRDDDNVLLFGNQMGQGTVEDHHVGDGAGWQPYTWNSTITAVEQVNANTFLVALLDGALERFTYSNAGSVTIATVPEVRDLALDPVSGAVYMAAGTEVKAIDPTSGQILASYPTGTPVYYALPLLNR